MTYKMGLFSKKKKEDKLELPLPEFPKFEEFKLPSYETSGEEREKPIFLKPEKPLTTEKFGDELEKPSFRFKNLELERPPEKPMERPFERPSAIPFREKPFLRRAEIERPRFREEEIRVVEEKPLFIKIEEYKKVFSDVEAIKNKIRDAEEIINKLEKIREQEEHEISGWKSDLERIKDHLIAIDKKISSAE